MGLFDYLIESGLQGIDTIRSLNPLNGLQSEIDNRSSRDKPGEFCIPVCVYNDGRCEVCLEREKRLKDKLKSIERLESASLEENSRESDDKKITKCQVCKAPIDKTRDNCPYCSAPYPIDNSIPSSSIERERVLDEAINSAWVCIKEIMDIETELMRSMVNDSAVGVVQKQFLRLADTEMVKNYRNASVQEIKYAAKMYGLPVSKYLYRIMKGESMPPRLAKQQLYTQGHL